jgi:cyanophycin synthetase
MFQPAAIFHIQCPVELPSEERLAHIHRVRSHLFKMPHADHLILGYKLKPSLIHLVTSIAMDILLCAKMPIQSGARLIYLSKEGTFVLGLPALGSAMESSYEALDFSIRLINSAMHRDIDDLQLVGNTLNKIISKHQRNAPAGINSLRFIDAAHDLQIPWYHVVNNVYQFGWGVNARLLNSSFTDATSLIGSQLARSKYSCARALGRLGIPTPKHLYVRSEQDVRELCQKLGFPLVIKPENLDGGRGVVVGIDNLEDLLLAYKNAAKLSPKVLMEKYISGNDYRLQVFDKQVYWIAHRRPARVVGDGQATIVELIRRVNAQRAQISVVDPDDEKMTEFGSEQIIVDDQVHIWLKKQDLTLNSIPSIGCEIRLKGAANFSQGGTREGICLTKVHPDNMDLAIQAVTALRLDLAGVDLLIPDISQSYKKVGGVICEVNAQPQLSKHLPYELLQKLVTNFGRIPTVMILDLNLSLIDKERIDLLVRHNNVKVGWAQTVNDCQRLLADPDVGMLIWHTKQIPRRYDHWPVDRIDVLVTRHQNITSFEEADQSSSQLWPSLPDRVEELAILDQIDERLDGILGQLLDRKKMVA